MADKNWSSGEQYQLAMSLKSTFGEFSPATIDAIAYTLGRHVWAHHLCKCVVMDVGSGRGKLGMWLKDKLHVRAVVGVEFADNLHCFAQTNSMGTNCVFAKKDMCTMTSFKGANIILGQSPSVCIAVNNCTGTQHSHACVRVVRVVLHCMCTCGAAFGLRAAFDVAFGDKARGHMCKLFNESPDTFVLMSCSKDLCERHGM
jgi:hypothetical protein